MRSRWKCESLGEAVWVSENVYVGYLDREAGQVGRNPEDSET